MSGILSRLRSDLDFIPSPSPEQPGLLLRDPMQYSDVILVIPPEAIQYLSYYDGRHEHEPQLKPLTEALSNAGFLHDAAFAQRRQSAQQRFAEAPVRLPAHAGSGYPDELPALREQMNLWMGDTVPPAPAGRLIGIAAPHVSPSGGYRSYRAAYAALTPEYKDRTFIILGTSHYGAPDTFGLTSKPYVTPFGETQTAPELLDRLGGVDEDYCHAVEHSIEFQVLFLQSIYGADVRVLPILCGSYAASIYKGGAPEANDHVRRQLDVLGGINATHRGELFWILGVDMAHMGKRYGDDFAAQADRDQMRLIAEQDHARIDRICDGDAAGFWELVQHNQDDLKWCGSAPFYTFLKAVPEARACLQHYQQWNIDPESVVSFAGMQLYSK